MPDLKEVLLTVADELDIETSIIEKDYYVVELLRLLQLLKFEAHDLVLLAARRWLKSISN